MKIEEMLKELDNAFKAITVSDLGSAVLQPEKFQQFVQTAQNASSILNDARRFDMMSDKKDIDRVGYGSRLLKDEANLAEVKPTFATNRLDVVKVRGVTGLTDDTLEENIARGNLEDLLIQLMATRAGLDIEELGVKGDSGSGDTYLALTDGWNKLAGVQLTGTTDTDFDQDDVESMLEEMLIALPQPYRRNRQNLRYYVAFNVENAYRNVLRSRGTGLGDTAQVGAGGIAYKGIPLIEVPNMPSNAGTLTPRDNIVWGVFREIRMEKDRIPATETTNFYISAKVDFHYEDEDGAVHAKNALVV